MLGNRLFKEGVICMFLQTFNTRISNRGAHKLLDLTSKGDGFRILGQIEKMFCKLFAHECFSHDRVDEEKTYQ